MQYYPGLLHTDAINGTRYKIGDFVTFDAFIISCNDKKCYNFCNYFAVFKLPIYGCLFAPSLRRCLDGKTDSVGNEVTGGGAAVEFSLPIENTRTFYIFLRQSAKLIKSNQLGI